mgnify:CR=1 FL=1
MKKTIKTLEFDYISYSDKEPVTADLDFDGLFENISSFNLIKTDIPLRASEVCFNYGNRNSSYDRR